MDESPVDFPLLELVYSFTPFKKNQQSKATKFGLDPLAMSYHVIGYLQWPMIFFPDVFF